MGVAGKTLWHSSSVPRSTRTAEHSWQSWLRPESSPSLVSCTSVDLLSSPASQQDPQLADKELLTWTQQVPPDHPEGWGSVREPHLESSLSPHLQHLAKGGVILVMKWYFVGIAIVESLKRIFSYNSYNSIVINFSLFEWILTSFFFFFYWLLFFYFFFYGEIYLSL